jgi:hypothetical protein
MNTLTAQKGLASDFFPAKQLLSRMIIAKSCQKVYNVFCLEFPRNNVPSMCSNEWSTEL